MGYNLSGAAKEGKKFKEEKKRLKFKNWNDLPLFLTLDEAGLVLGVSRSTVKRLAQKGVLPCKKVSPHSWRIEKEKLKSWAES